MSISRGAGRQAIVDHIVEMLGMLAMKAGVDAGALRLARQLEPLTAVTYLATITQRIHVGTSVLVIPYRNPVFTAKALATADYLSGGRVILGAGIGWWREEFAALGVPFEERAARKYSQDSWNYRR